mmetsp:Transcript_18733/g.40749  ORF Transcript_18733/g.40749 Transcript_18733/m.40749 type:complete len:92 (-) Transcript_18733:25-300(-)
MSYAPSYSEEECLASTVIEVVVGLYVCAAEGGKGGEVVGSGQDVDYSHEDAGSDEVGCGHDGDVLFIVAVSIACCVPASLLHCYLISCCAT